MPQIPPTNGDAQRPLLNVAIVGAGPAGYYSALELFSHEEFEIHVDMFDRIPPPYGLVRYGVAPDHAKIKSVIKVYERGVEAPNARFRYFGNVELSTDISVDELLERYHAVILTFGAQGDRKLGVPGEDLPGIYAAREFVAWYNSHPDHRDAQFDLKGKKRALVVGVGNVAIDVARILMRTPSELAKTDISPLAEALVNESDLEEVVVLARRGPAQAAATPVEMLELTKMEACDFVVSERDIALDPETLKEVEAGNLDKQTKRSLEIMRENAHREAQPGRKTITMRFYESPVEFLGTEQVEAVKIVRNALVRRDNGSLASKPTEETFELPVDVVFRSIGYMITPTDGVPYDAEWRWIPNQMGRVQAERNGEVVQGLYIAGWAKRGPSGVIGTNKPDAVETVQLLLEDRATGRLREPSGQDIADLLDARGIAYVGYEQWKALDRMETAAGEAEGRPRVKFLDVDSMLAAVAGEALAGESVG